MTLVSHEMGERSSDGYARSRRVPNMLATLRLCQIASCSTACAGVTIGMLWNC